MGRPRSFDRDAALELARDAFWRDGYRATSISALTQQIGIKPPSLYAAFGDKRQLFDTIAGSYVEHLLSAIADQLDAPTARDGVARLLQALAEQQSNPDTPPGCLVLSEPLLAEERAQIRDAVAQRIAQGINAGDVSPDADAEQLANLVNAIILGISARARDGATRDELTTTARLAMSIWPNPTAVPPLKKTPGRGRRPPHPRLVP